ncbi:hypothetical protein BC936DRAFT_139396 [Jimgerdemannia flammicorona]|uniref:Uncharacterized protein n=1 Tax=Jimgerdemannia flammicorona TaxID=994334 RepID=A0A433DHW7_9FUNG|nr:hypothetical protein BC936DRAFT_139396 [Jimgerdemannia flammicorona]
MRKPSSFKSLMSLLLLGALLLNTANAQVSPTAGPVATSAAQPTATVVATPAASTPAASAPATSAPASNSALVSSPVSDSNSISASSAVSQLPSATTSQAPVGTGCLDADFNTVTDFFPDKLQLNGSSGFKVQYQKFYKIINNLKSGEFYLLYCSRSAPNVSFPVKGLVQIPVTNAAALDINTIGFLDLLGKSSSLKYISDPKNVTSPCISQTLTTFSSSVTDADVIFSNKAEPNDKRYVTISIDDTMTPLQKAEWIKFYGLFFNLEKQSEDIYNNVVSQYNCHQQNMQKAEISNRRNISWIGWDPNGPAFNYKTDADIYYKQLTQDAGAIFTIPSSNTLYRIYTNDTLRGQLQNASHVIDLTPFSQADASNIKSWLSLTGYSFSQVNASDYTAMTNALTNAGNYINDPQAPPFMRYKRLWRLDYEANTNGIADYTNRGVARPDLVLQDLIAIQFPTYQSWTRDFLRNFSSESLLTPSASSYGCGSSNFGSCAAQNFKDGGADNPFITNTVTPGELSTEAKIGLGTAGGLIGLAFLAGTFVAFRRRMKDKNTRQFAPLGQSEAFEMPRGGEAIYDDPSAEPARAGRFGGGRGGDLDD